MGARKCPVATGEVVSDGWGLRSPAGFVLLALPARLGVRWGLGFASSHAEEGPWGCRGAEGEELHPVDLQVEWGSRSHTA